jgi:hypothetical protein
LHLGNASGPEFFERKGAKCATRQVASRYDADGKFIRDPEGYVYDLRPTGLWEEIEWIPALRIAARAAPRESGYAINL